MQEEKVLLLNSFLKSISFKPPIVFYNLVIFPLFSEKVLENNYLLLDEAMSTGKFHIKEVSQSGSVPELLVINELDRDVLLLEGDILKGAKQHRTINATIIVGKNREMVIPVSCVERGRWSYTSDNFQSSDIFCDVDLRWIKSRSVSESLRHRRGYRSDQGGIWNEIHRKMGVFNAYSQTESVEDVYYSRMNEFGDYIRNFKLLDGQAGFAVLINGELSGIEIFGVEGVINKLFRKILSSYIYKAIEIKRSFRHFRGYDIGQLEQYLRKMLEDIHNFKKECFKSVGEGYDIRFEREDITGFALEHENKIVHFATFKKIGLRNHHRFENDFFEEEDIE